MSIIVFSRKVGSQGDEIAALTAQRLGYRLVGREEVHRLAQECDSQFAKACSAFESELQPGFFERMFMREPAYKSLFESLNLELASQGDVVMLGRGAQIVLADFPGVLRVRVVAPMQQRVGNLMQREKVTRAQAVEFLDHHDRLRRNLIESLFHHNLSDWSLYDLVINTARIAPATAVEMVSTAARDLPLPGDPQAALGQMKNQALAKRVESAIKKKVATTPFHEITVTCPQAGTMVIEGLVTHEGLSEEVAKIASGFPGVTKVDNRLVTTNMRF